MILPQAAPARLPELNLGRRGIESRVHCIADKVLGEDTWRVRTGVLARVLVELSNLAIGIFRPMELRKSPVSRSQCTCAPTRLPP